MLLKKRRSQANDLDSRPQYELDYDLSPLERDFMFWEYLEIGKQFKGALSCYLGPL